MAILNYNKICSRNVAGNTRIFLAEVPNVTAVTVTAGEISAITGAGAFKEIQADTDTIIRTETKVEGKYNARFDARVEMKLGKQSLNLNTFLDSVANASPCGIFALIKDNNGTWWLVGYNESDLFSRGLKVSIDEMTSGAGFAEDGGGVSRVELFRNLAAPSMPLDATLSALIDAGTALFVDYAGCSGYSNLLDNSGFIVDGIVCNGDWVDSGAPNGTADDWDQESGTGTPAIVTGNGFSGNAQRINHVTGTITRFSQSTGVTAENGETYRITGKWRAGAANWRIYLRTTSDVITNNMTVNTGNASDFQFDGVAGAAAEIVLTFYKHSEEASDYLEVDELRVWKIT